MFTLYQKRLPPVRTPKNASMLGAADEDVCVVGSVSRLRMTDGWERTAKNISSTAFRDFSGPSSVESVNWIGRHTYCSPSRSVKEMNASIS